MEFAKKIPPKCIRGRWGAVSNCETFAMKPPTEHLINVLQEVADAGLRKSSRKKPANHSIHEVDIEESEMFTEKMAKWRQDVKKRISEPKFWWMMRVSHHARGPLDHFVHYLMKKASGPQIPQALARMQWYNAKACTTKSGFQIRVRSQISVSRGRCDWNSLFSQEVLGDGRCF